MERAFEIAYYVHGRGRGHASRALSLIPALRGAGYQVSVFASGEALAVLRPLGPVRERAVVQPGRAALIGLARRALQEHAELRRRKPALVVSDGDQGALLAARSAHIPAIAIGHDLVFSCCVLPPGLSRLHLLHQQLNSLIAARLSTRRIAVHFLPIVTRDMHTRVARVEVDESVNGGAVPRADHVVCYFRDANAARVVELTRSLLPKVLAYGAALGRPPTSRDDFRSLLGTARAAIGSAGSNLIAECVLLGTPLLALYEADDAEQALNAQLLEAAGVGVACSFVDFGEATVRAFWQRVCANHFETINLRDSLPSIVHELLSTTATLLLAPDQR